MPGLPRRWISVVSSRATRLAEIDVSGTAARHSRVTSSTTLRMRKRRPQANWSCTKSSDPAGILPGLDDDRCPRTYGTPACPAPAHGQPFLAIEPVDAVDAG